LGLTKDFEDSVDKQIQENGLLPLQTCLKKKIEGFSIVLTMLNFDNAKAGKQIGSSNPCKCAQIQ
jgi:hypothetical protein